MDHTRPPTDPSSRCPLPIDDPYPLERVPRALRGRHFVYVLRDAARRAVYVGCTSDLHERVASHSGMMRLYGAARAYSTAHEFATRADAYRAEQSAIKVLRPVANRQGLTGRERVEAWRAWNVA